MNPNPAGHDPLNPEYTIEEKYMNYLGSEVLIDDHIVTYRSVSRALRIHVNLAKQLVMRQPPLWSCR
jgi:hypothetical protein